MSESNKPSLASQPLSPPDLVATPPARSGPVQPLTPPPIPPPVASLPVEPPPPQLPNKLRVPLPAPPTTTRPQPPGQLDISPTTVVTAPRRRRWFGRRRITLPVASAGEQQAAKNDERRKLPAWMVSFIVHLIFILILAAVPLGKLAQGPLALMLGFSASAGIAEFELSSVDSPVDAEPLDANLEVPEPIDDVEQLLNVALPELVKVEKATTPGEEPALSLTEIPFGITNGLKGRSGELKAALLSKFGGNSDTEAAVDLGLKWLAKQQKSNGSWSLVGPYSDGGVSENVTAATAMALNAFLGAGSTPQAGKYQENVRLGLNFLVRKQNEDGYFPDAREPSRQQMYAQAIATITLAEAYGMTNDSTLRIAAQKAITFAEWSQSPLRGWRYEPREDADVSVTGWFVMALETGKMAGLTVDEAKLQQVNEFLDSVAYSDQSRYAYDGFEPPSLTMTAEGLLCRIYLGWPRTHPALMKAINNDLLTSAPSANEKDYRVYYGDYATHVLHHVGGGSWEQWNRAMRRAIPALQERAGAEAGSWSPSRDAFGAAGGRLYTTCLNLYCLEVYYRHLALFDSGRGK